MSSPPRQPLWPSAAAARERARGGRERARGGRERAGGEGRAEEDAEEEAERLYADRASPR